MRVETWSSCLGQAGLRLSIFLFHVSSARIIGVCPMVTLNFYNLHIYCYHKQFPKEYCVLP
jgi:hypothetical protein